jgi:hypothetical protein
MAFLIYKNKLLQLKHFTFIYSLAGQKFTQVQSKAGTQRQTLNPNATIFYHLKKETAWQKPTTPA